MRVACIGGGPAGLYFAISMKLRNPSHEVVVFEPFYDSYAAVIALARGRQVDVPLRSPGFRPDLDELRAAVTERLGSQPRATHRVDTSGPEPRWVFGLIFLVPPLLTLLSG